MSNQAIAKTTDVRGLIESPKFKEEVAKVLPKHLTPERMVRVGITAVMKNPDLLKCTPASVMNCLMLCSQAGLEPDGRLAHLIPYGTTCQLIFDYKGLVTLALRNGYTSVWADKVCEGDEFNAGVEDGRKVLEHTINWRQPRGEVYAYYAVAVRNDSMDFEVMTMDEVKAIQKRSRAGKSGPWMTDFDEMAKKCPLRRMSKRWDLLPEIRDIVFADDDTPAIDVKSTAAPIFKNPEQKELPAVSEPLDDSGDVAGQPEPIEEAAPKKQPASKPKAEVSVSTQIRDIRARLVSQSISEKSLIEYLVVIGTVNECRSLEEVNQQSDTAIGMIHGSLDSIFTNMKEAK